MQAEPKLLSLAVPVYNGEKYLPGCLESLKAAIEALSVEDRARVEIVLCDNRSTDKSLELLQAHEIPCDVHIVQPPEHFSNRTRNWDYALRQGSGTWIVMLHADDRMAPDGFGAMLRAIRQKAASKAVVIGGRHRVFKEGEAPGELHPHWPMPALVSGTKLRERILPVLCVFLPFLLMRRSAYGEVGGLDSSYELLQDWDLWFKILKKGDYYYHPEAFCHWLSHPYGEKLQNLFATEHLKFLFRLDQAGVSPLARSASFQLAKIRTWIPGIEPATLVQGLPEEAFVRSLPPVDAASAPGILKSCGRGVGIELQVLRLMGFFRR